MIEWAWVLRLVEGMKPKSTLNNWGNGTVQVGCVQGNITVVNLSVPLRDCCGHCTALEAGQQNNQRRRAR
ncbi:hypothetical protein LJR118_002851 [Acidovorax sp. LjRoot118]|uniref:hypothetical protein n=1 Tax=Acidovorax sp. LjRoot118 TaxID=3342256 RepID=UPI003ECE8E95